MKKIEKLRKKLILTRHRRGDSAREVAEDTPISRSTVQNFEGKYGAYKNGSVGKKVIINICDYLDEDPGDYLDW